MRKALNRNRLHRQKKRNDRLDAQGNERPAPVTYEEFQTACREPGPADIAELKDLIDTALNRLGETDRKVVESFLESGSTEQTAILFIISTRSVQRVIKIFRESLEALGLGGE